MLVVFPFALLVTAVIFDVINLITGQPTWRLVAFYNLAAGIVGALLAAVPGLIDYFSLRGRAARTGTWHMIANLTAVAIFVAAFLLRTRWGEQWVPAGSTLPQILGIVGVVVLAVGGWLGGHLVYVEGVGVDAEARGRAADATGRRRAA
jgi:uncharacterized membrane protein